MSSIITKKKFLKIENAIMLQGKKVEQRIAKILPVLLSTYSTLLFSNFLLNWKLYVGKVRLDQHIYTMKSEVKELKYYIIVYDVMKP